MTFVAVLLAAWLQGDVKTWLDAHAASFSGAVLVARGDRVEAAAAYGAGNTVDTAFNVGSINKTFTAVAVAQLIQQGKLALDDTLAKHLPNYANREAATRITIRDLISHRSGVAQFMRADFGDVSVEAMAKAVAAEPQAFEPGTRQEYSNGGYILLGRVIEVVSRQPYSAYMQEHVYGPSGMTVHQPAGNPAGGGFFTVHDLFRFSRALKGAALLDAKTTNDVLTGTFAAEGAAKFGFGLREQIVGGRRFVGNGGGAPGINAEFRLEPAGDVTVVALSNASPPAATQLLSEILGYLTGR
jgi:CubicO group peptidase (beta-lactamase class C family)